MRSLTHSSSARARSSCSKALDIRPISPRVAPKAVATSRQITVAVATHPCGPAHKIRDCAKAPRWSVRAGSSEKRAGRQASRRDIQGS
jgi:hypothetical protein